MRGLVELQKVKIRGRRLFGTREDKHRSRSHWFHATMQNVEVGIAWLFKMQRTSELTANKSRNFQWQKYKLWPCLLRYLVVNVTISEKQIYVSNSIGHTNTEIISLYNLHKCCREVIHIARTYKSSKTMNPLPSSPCLRLIITNMQHLNATSL